MYLYRSLVKRKVTEFYNNIDKRRYLVWLKWLIFIAISGQLMVSLVTWKFSLLQPLKWHIFTNLHSKLDFFLKKTLLLGAYLIISSNIIGYSKWNGLLEREFIGNKWGNLLDCFATQPWPIPRDTLLWADFLCIFVNEGCSTHSFCVNKKIA